MAGAGGGFSVVRCIGYLLAVVGVEIREVGRSELLRVWWIFLSLDLEVYKEVIEGF